MFSMKTFSGFSLLVRLQPDFDDWTNTLGEGDFFLFFFPTCDLPGIYPQYVLQQNARGGVGALLLAHSRSR
jgi:hypothetical protein